MELSSKDKSAFRIISNVLTQNGYEVRMVGGAVRDLLRNIYPSDIDFATTAPPERVLSLFQNEYAGFTSVGTGLSHGTVTVNIKGAGSYEVTTLRVDVETDGRHAEVEFTADWEADAARRDFTMNAMYMDIDGNIFDYYNGRTDLRHGIVRFVGRPADRIKEDYLRILRYFRFSAYYGDLRGFVNDEIIANAIMENAEGLQNVSGERIWSEITKILAAPTRTEIIQAMEKLNVAKNIGLPTPRDGLSYLAYNRRADKNTSWISAVVALARDVPTLDEMRKRWKFDTNSYKIMCYVIKNRKERFSLEIAKARIARGEDASHVRQLAIFLMQDDVADAVKDMPPPPKFPINGNDLKTAGLEGKKIGEVLDELKEEWIASVYTMDRADLMELLYEPRNGYVK